MNRTSDSSRASNCSKSRRSSHVFATVGRNSSLVSSSNLSLVATSVLQGHMDSKAEFVYVIQVNYNDLSWEIQKRYSDLSFFNEKRVGAQHKDLPAKMAGKTTYEHAVALLPALNDWLAFLPQPQHCQQLCNFMELYLHQPQQPRGAMSRCSAERLLYAGYLRKLGGNKTGGAGNWKRRYMVLQRDLLYYEDEDCFRNGGLPKGTISLNAFCVEERAGGLLNEFVIHSMPHPLVCRAASPEDLQAWLQALRGIGESSRQGVLPAPRKSAANGFNTSATGSEEEDDDEEEEIVWAD